MRVAFAGTPPFAAAALQALHDAGHDIALVLSQPDRPAGRGLKVQPSAVKALALALGLPVAQPQGLKLDGRFAADAQAAQQALRAAAPEVLVVAAYGLILPPWLLALAPRGAVNIHASLLPRWRGAAPVQRAIEAGDRATGITLMQMDSGLDTGPTLATAREPIRADDSAGTLLERLAALGARLLVETLPQRPPPQPQPADGVSYAHKIDKREAAVDWTQPAVVIERRLRAFDPAPGCHAVVDGQPVKLWRADVVDGRGEPGRRLPDAAGRLVVACGDGALALRTLQPAGGRRMTAAAFLHSRSN